MPITHFVVDGTIGVKLTDTYASAGALPFAEGFVVRGNHASTWMLVKATSTIAQYDAVAILSTVSASATGEVSIGAVPITTTNMAAANHVGFAQTAITSAQYGWVALSGNGLRVNCLIAAQPAVPLFTTATAGSLDDATASVGYVQGVQILSSATSASAPAAIVANPHITKYGASA